jgi:hypothetical protein
MLKFQQEGKRQFAGNQHSTNLTSSFSRSKSPYSEAIFTFFPIFGHVKQSIAHNNESI